MRRGHLVLLVLFAFSATASAQTVTGSVQVRFFPSGELALFPPQGAATEVHASPDRLVARLMSFDRDRDGRIVKEELFERMEGLVAQGDASADGVLDEAEIRAMAERPAPQNAVRGFQPGHYGFGDESGLSSRLHIEGALDDLKLASPAKEKAAAIVTAFVSDLEQRVMKDLRKDMDGQRFRNRLRPGDAERSELLDQLTDILTDEERDDFRAALERRPVVKAGGVMFSNVQIVNRVFQVR